MCGKEFEQLSSIYFENIIIIREPSFIEMKTYQKMTFNLSMWYLMKYVKKYCYCNIEILFFYMSKGLFGEMIWREEI